MFTAARTSPASAYGATRHTCLALAASFQIAGRRSILSEPDPIIVALDFENAAAANSLVAALGNEVSFYKVGLELYTAAGMYFVHELIGAGKNVFLDLKLYDIPETVRRAVWQVAQAGVRFLTVHARKPVM